MRGSIFIVSKRLCIARRILLNERCESIESAVKAFYMLPNHLLLRLR